MPTHSSNKTLSGRWPPSFSWEHQWFLMGDFSTFILCKSLVDSLTCTRKRQVLCNKRPYDFVAPYLHLCVTSSKPAGGLPLSTVAHTEAKDGLWRKEKQQCDRKWKKERQREEGRGENDIGSMQGSERASERDYFCCLQVTSLKACQTARSCLATFERLERVSRCSVWLAVSHVITQAGSRWDGKKGRWGIRLVFFPCRLTFHLKGRFWQKWQSYIHHIYQSLDITMWIQNTFISNVLSH